MSADATDPDGILTRTGYIHDGCFVDEIDLVDLSDLELDDNDDWLYIPPRCSTESTIHDLYAWLKTEPELDSRDNKKCIDSRTFTRPKRRSARMSFESIFEGLPPSIKGIGKPQSKDVITHTEDEEKSILVTIKDQESVPLMLKPSTKAAMNVSSNEYIPVSGQESMEAFLNMSQSKGIDSFINLREPEFSDLLMNVSQPSLLYTSITSSMNELTNLSVIKNDAITSLNISKNSSNVEELSNSSSSNNETFVMQAADKTITPNSLDRTRTLSKTFCEEPVRLNRGLNETYDTEAANEASALRPSLDKEDTDTATLSSTFVTERNVDATFVKPRDQADNDNIRIPLDATYLSSERVEGPNFPASTKNDTYKSAARANKADLNVTCDIVTEEIEGPAIFLETPADEHALDISFKVPVCNQSTPMNPAVLNPASKLATKRPDQARQASYPTLKAPMSLRRELLTEIQRSGERKLDSTYNHSDHTDHVRDTKTNICAAYNENEIDVPPSNRYNTYRKSTLAAATNQCASRNETATAQKELPDQRKFYTFTKRSNNYVEKADSTDANRNAEQIPRPNLDGTFCKPRPPKTQSRNKMPKMLSKLPQFLQKSNPNLVSGSLKTGHTASGLPVSCISNIGYMKGSQPNIVQNIAEKSQLQSKLHPYGKLKSGSEQRLLEMNVNTNSQFPMKGLTAGSTESIESTQSAHSAPDLDDRLSTCSDSSSQNSCTRPAMNIEQLHQLVRMQEESLKQDSAVKPNIRVLENTWVEAKTDLPSPILKNGVGYNETDRRHSMLNTDFSMKCSSPIISPMGSSHALNNDGTSEDNVAKTKDEVTVSDKTEDPDQLVPKVENKTRLKQPTNWGTRSSKPATVISGIPRPASRIPALRFARPNAKATQGDLRKGNT